MKPRKKMLIMARVADLMDLGPGLAQKLGLEAKLLGYEVGLCLMGSGKLELNQLLVAVFAAFNEVGNFHGIELLTSENQLEENAQSCLIEAFSKIEAQKKNEICEEKDFPEHFDCPHHYAIQKEQLGSMAEILLDEQGEVLMRSNCVRGKIRLGNIQKDSLSKILVQRKVLQAKLLKQILRTGSEKKLSCQACSKIKK